MASSLVLEFGAQTDTQAINGGPAGELTPERVAAYIAKYATKSADDFGVGDRRISLDALPQLDLSPHVARIVQTCWALGKLESYDGLRRRRPRVDPCSHAGIRHPHRTRLRTRPHQPNRPARPMPATPRKPTLCEHSRPTWCTTIHAEEDERLGQPICGDCYGYPAHVAFNWNAPELWRRFTITLRRVLAHRAGLTSTEFRQRARVSFVKVAEYQRRAVVHFHALIRLDAPGDTYEPCDLPLGAVDLADAIREAAGLVRLVIDLPGGPAGTLPPTQVLAQGDCKTPGEPVPPRVIDDLGPAHPYHHRHKHIQGEVGDQNGTAPPSPADHLADPHPISIREPERIVLRFGTQTDTQAINGGPTSELTPERVAAYIAKYATKSADDFGVGDRRISLDALPMLDVSPHVARIVQTCWALGDHESYEGLRRWLHMLGFRGHFASKSRRYSTTLGAIRAERRTYARQRAAAAGDAREIPDEETTLVISRWEFAGLGYLTSGDAELAMSAAARARERRQAARDAVI